MVKDTRIAVRLEAATKDALETAAAADRRSISSMVEKIVVDWLARRKPKAGAGKKGRRG